MWHCQMCVKAPGLILELALAKLLFFSHFATLRECNTEMNRLVGYSPDAFAWPGLQSGISASLVTGLPKELLTQE